MTECSRTSTLSRSATSAAFRSGRTLKPMTMALLAEASSTSNSEIAPTPEWMMRIRTLSSLSFCSVSASTSAEPWASAFGAERLVLRLLLAEERNLARLGRVRDGLERVAGLRQTGEPEHLDRSRRAGLLRRVPAIVDERADLADHRA